MAYEVELGKYLAMVFSGLGVLVMIAERRSFWVARLLMATLSLDCDAASFSLFTVMVSTSFERFLAMAAKDSNTEGGYCFGGIESWAHCINIRRMRVLVDNQMDTQASDTNWGERLPSMDNNERLPTRVALKSVGWRWQYLPETSFEEVGQAPLSKFRISCNIESKILSRDTTYAGYLVYKQKLYYFQPAPAQVEDVNLEEMSDIYLQIPQTPVLISGEVCEDTRNRSHRPNIKGIPQERRDGCMEVQIWEFKTNRNTENISMDLKLSSYDKRSLKGLKAKGIEFRPVGNN
ncbi:kinase-like domain, phloem protein 2-like protein [Tanacetum coccineum]